MMDSSDAFVRDALPILANAAQMLDEMKMSRQSGADGLPWTAWNQAQRDDLTALLRRAHTLSVSEQLP